MRGAIYNGSTITTSRKIGLFFSSSPSLISPQSLIYEKYVYKRIEIITNNLKQQRDMGNLIKGLKVAAYVAEIIVAGSVPLHKTTSSNQHTKNPALHHHKSSESHHQIPRVDLH